MKETIREYGHGLDEETREKIGKRWEAYVKRFGLAGDMLIRLLHGREWEEVPPAEREEFKELMDLRAESIDKERGAW